MLTILHRYKLINIFDTTNSLFFALLLHKRYNVNMEGLNFKKKSPENSKPEQTPFTKIEEKKITDPYLKWMAEKGLKGETDFSQLRYIEEAIINENEEDIKKALDFAMSYYRDREDLIAKLNILKGNFDDAKKIILEYKDRDLDDVMVGSLSLLLKKNPEKRDNIMNEVAEENPELIEYIKNRY